MHIRQLLFQKQKNRGVYPAVSIWPCCQEKVVGAERFTSYISEVLNGGVQPFYALHYTSTSSFVIQSKL